MSDNIDLPISVQEWHAAGSPVGVPFLLVRESRVLASRDDALREMEVLKALIVAYAEGGTIGEPFSFGRSFRVVVDGGSFLIQYDVARRVIVACAVICMHKALIEGVRVYDNGAE